MRALRLSLIAGGLFNGIMGLIFLNNGLLQGFFSKAEAIERSLFQSSIVATLPTDPLHQLLIHGFGAGVVILGATLLYAVKNPYPLRVFIGIDGLGRLLFSCMLFYYVVTYSLMRTILLFGVVEFFFALAYLWGSWALQRWKVEGAK